MNRYDAILCFTLLGLVTLFSRPVAAEDDHLVADFEAGDYGDWTALGEAFGDRPVGGRLPGQMDVRGFRGDRLVNSFNQGDATTGSLLSPRFEIDRDYLVFLVGGGRLPGDVGVELLLDGKVVRATTGRDSEILSWHSWKVAEFRGQQGQVRIFDHATGSWGHINVDQILLSNAPRVGSGSLRLEEYRQSPEYYRERFRPQIHFSPEMNWMNDPNGLVFFQGEYHLCYQHNPHGNTWGHISWGHAVSRDLVHWEHLPIALHEEYGVMAFSGSAVVDWENTSGFGRAGEPPLVAIYTGHGHGKQTQELAFSTDRGRTWTKYTGNPVLDIGRKNFRDPKVFWHPPTKKWVMTVSLAAAKRVQFYGSADLKHWEHLSDFGPAGVEKKNNWECPDLFPLPIEGEAGKTRWVLEVDMGSGAIAGGSGGEYFVGNFDGTEFHADSALEQVSWVDYGRDFYAPISWSDIPSKDGRRIWIGWMNNWETHLLPTSPWRSALSLPRVLALRRTAQGMRLVQNPVAELQQLRRGHRQLPPSTLEGTFDLEACPAPCEIIAEFDLGSAEEFGLRLAVGEDESTTIGYDVKSQELFVDRRRSGKADFHKQFAGRHAGPLPAENGRIKLHVFLDTSSVEVFGNDGHTVITDRIFPHETSRRAEIYTRGGDVGIRSVDLWELNSIWQHEAGN